MILFILMLGIFGKVKFWRKIVIEAIRAKLFLQIISGYMNLKFKQNK
jgi:hypothetical protein